jgi:hypothetical protein
MTLTDQRFTGGPFRDIKSERRGLFRRFLHRRLIVMGRVPETWFLFFRSQKRFGRPTPSVANRLRARFPGGGNRRRGGRTQPAGLDDLRLQHLQKALQLGP